MGSPVPLNLGLDCLNGLLYAKGKQPLSVSWTSDGGLMQTYLINLDCRQDRLEWSRKQLDRHGIFFHRIAAIDKTEANHLSKTAGFQPFPGFVLSDGEIGCFLSHIKAWKEFLKTGNEYCLVLEDDVVVSPSLRHFLDHFARSSIEADTVRVETYLSPVRLERRVARRIGSVSLHRLQSAHYGSAAYILSRPFALKLLNGTALPLLPPDHLLFDPISPFFDKARIFQTMPGLCIQADRMPAEYVASIHESDLKDDRDRRRTAFLGPEKPRKKPRTFAGKIVREATRIADQFGRLTGVKQLIKGKLWTVVPFSGGLPSENTTSSSIPVSSDQQAMQSQMRIS